MHILQLTLRIPYPPTDGGAQAMYHLGRALHAAGHTLTVAALNTRKHRQDPAVLADYATVVATELDTTPRPLHALYWETLGNLPYNIARFKSAAHAATLTRLLQAQTFDVIQLEGVYPAVYLPVLRAHTKAPIILRAHNVEYRIWEQYAAHERRQLRKWFFQRLAKRGRTFEAQALPQCDGVVAFTPQDAADFRTLGYTGPLAVIPAGAEVGPETAPTDAPEVAFLANLEWLPNVQGLEWFLNEVWPLIEQRMPTARLSVAGRKMPDAFRRYASETVRLVGETPEAQAFLAPFPVVVVPLLSGSGIRMKILEALGLGKAIVCTSTAVQGIEAADGEHLRVADAPQAFADAVVDLLARRNEASRLGAAGRRLVAERYDWRARAEDFIRFYATCGC